MLGICFLYSIKLWDPSFWLLNIFSLTLWSLCSLRFLKIFYWEITCVSKDLSVFQPCHTSLGGLIKFPLVSQYSPSSITHITVAVCLGQALNPQNQQIWSQRNKLKANYLNNLKWLIFVQKHIYPIFSTSIDIKKILKYDFLSLLLIFYDGLEAGMRVKV